MDERYNVGSLIEELSYGKQYAAEDSLIQRPVQIFRFETPEGDEDKWKDTFGELSSELATIAHPGLPIIYDHGSDDEGPYLIRQLQESVDINHHLVQNGAFSEYEGWELAHQMLEIFDAARTTGNFHGALDPAHVRFMARPSGAKRFTITDYGLAEIYNQINGNTEYLGAPYLISPEQARGEKANEQSQIFAIGQLIFHALSGGHPWLETPLEDITQTVQENSLDPITDYNPSIPEGFSDWLQKMIAIEPSERFQTYEEATGKLPEPIQSAPVPISASTATVSQTVAAAQVITASHAVHAAETHITTAAEDFAAQKAAQDEIKKKETISVLKNPIVIGAAGVIVLLIIVVILMAGGEEEKTPASASTSETIQESTPTIPQDGLVAFIDFDNSSVSDRKNSSYRLEPLKNSPAYSNNGLTGKALVLNKKNYYRLPISRTPLADKSKDFTVSFWIKSGSSKPNELAVVSNEPWLEGNAGSFEGDDSLWQWSPDGDSSLDSLSWSMVTMVYSRSDSSIGLFLNGEYLGSSSNDEINADRMSRYIYLGCDDNENFLHQSPMVLDDLAIWDRALTRDDISSMYENSTSYN
jgi:serine/threonine protein kinase